MSIGTPLVMALALLSPVKNKVNKVTEQPIVQVMIVNSSGLSALTSTPSPTLTPDSDDKIIVIPKNKQFDVKLDEERTIKVFGKIEDHMMEDIRNKLVELEKASNKPIYFIINSGGGQIDAGRKIENAMDGTKVKKVCIVDGAAYSMAAGIFLHCDQKLLSPGSDLMYHEGSLGVSGDKTVLPGELAHQLKVMDEMDKDNADHLHMKLKDYQVKVHDEWWLTSAEAVDEGIADGLAVGFKYTHETAPLSPFEQLFHL